MWLTRFYENNDQYLIKGKVNMLYGPRRVGKTVLIEKLLSKVSGKIFHGIGGYSRNLRKEVTKTYRYYFLDNGIRNAIINNFNHIDQRNDIGMLWENFMVMERIKKQNYHKLFSNNYFWRTYDKKEVDFVEEREGELFGFEFKWNPKKIKIQKEFLKTYSNASFEVIHHDNFMAFVC